MQESEMEIVLSDGDVRVWIEQETVHVKAVTRLGDPVELSDEETRQLAEALREFYVKISQ